MEDNKKWSDRKLIVAVGESNAQKYFDEGYELKYRRKDKFDENVEVFFFYPKDIC